MQRLLQENRPQGFNLRLPRRPKLHNRQKTTKSVPVLQVQQMPGNGDEKGGGAGRTTEDKGEGTRRGWVLRIAHTWHARREDSRSRKTGRMQDRKSKWIRKCRSQYLPSHKHAVVPVSRMGETHSSLLFLADRRPGSAAQGRYAEPEKTPNVIIRTQLLFMFLLSGWNELLIAAFSHRSVEVRDGIVLGAGITVHRNSAHQAGVGTIFDRVLTELVAKMRDMNMDKTELGCLRSIILFNPGKYWFAWNEKQHLKIIRKIQLSTMLSYYLISVKHWEEPFIIFIFNLL